MALQKIGETGEKLKSVGSSIEGAEADVCDGGGGREGGSGF